MKEDRTWITEILKLVRLLVVVVLAAGICLFVYTRYQDAKEPDITFSLLSGKLEAVSELTTCELAYTGMVKYSEGEIPFLTQNSFSMIYSAKVRAGIDLSKAQIDLTPERVVVSLPECVVQSIVVDTDSIEFYDERLALFNWTKKSDIIDAVSVAREDVSQKADMDSLLEHARLQTEAILKGLLADAVGDRELEIRQAEPAAGNE